MRQREFAGFAGESKKQLARICKNFKLYPQPGGSDYTYTEFFGDSREPKILHVRLESKDLAPAAIINICPRIKIAGELTAQLMDNASATKKTLALRLDLNWEYLTHAELTQETNLTCPQKSKLLTAVFDRAGALAKLTLAIKSPAQIKTQAQLHAIGREIVYYKKQSELARRYTQETRRQAARAEKLCTSQNQLTAAGVVWPGNAENI